MALAATLVVPTNRQSPPPRDLYFEEACGYRVTHTHADLDEPPLDGAVRANGRTFAAVALSEWPDGMAMPRRDYAFEIIGSAQRQLAGAQNHVPNTTIEALRARERSAYFVAELHQMQGHAVVFDPIVLRLAPARDRDHALRMLNEVKDGGIAPPSVVMSSRPPEEIVVGRVRSVRAHGEVLRIVAEPITGGAPIKLVQRSTAIRSASESLDATCGDHVVIGLAGGQPVRFMIANEPAGETVTSRRADTFADRFRLHGWPAQTISFGWTRYRDAEPQSCGR